MSTNDELRETFDTWTNKRGVWPRLTHQEIFEAGYLAALAASKPEPSGERAAIERMVHDFPALSAFHRKYGLGTLREPSCLCCGQIPEEVAIRHLDLPGIVICKKCHDAALLAADDSASYRNDMPVSDSILGEQIAKANEDQRLFGVGFTVNGWHIPARLVACWGMTMAADDKSGGEVTTEFFWLCEVMEQDHQHRPSKSRYVENKGRFQLTDDPHKAARFSDKEFCDAICVAAYAQGNLFVHSVEHAFDYTHPQQAVLPAERGPLILTPEPQSPKSEPLSTPEQLPQAR